MSRYSNEYGACEIDSLPGSPQVAVSHAVFIQPEFRGKGIGNQNHRLRLRRLKEMHYDCVICTVRGDNDKEKRNLSDNGWHFLMRFQSSNTNHQVELWGRNV